MQRISVSGCRASLHLFLIAVLSVNGLVSAQESAVPAQDSVSDRLLPTGRSIQPVGKSLEIYGRPVDLVLSPDNRHLLVKDWKSLRVLDAKTMKLVQTIPSPGNASLFGIATTRTGDILLTNAGRGLNIFKPSDEDPALPYRFDRTIQLPENCFPCGVVASSKDIAYICLSKRNSLAVVDLKTDQLTREIPVGVAPFDVLLLNDEMLFVSNIGGRRAREGDKTAPSAGTETVVDDRGIASTGTISRIDLENLEVTSTDSVGLHPTVMEAAGDMQLFVCNTNQDTLTQIGLINAEHKTINVKPDESLPFGSMPSAIMASCDPTQHSLLFVALAGNNAVAVLDLDQKQGEQLVGLIPTGWYPAGLACNKDYLYIANIKGVGARSARRDADKGRNSHDHRGTIQQVALSDIRNPETIAQWTKQVKLNSRVPQILRSNENRLRNADVKPVPIPKKLGEPSVFKHVIYVIKENRTFDQVFGDVEQARSEPSLCVFPDRITPNHHALAKRFGLLDNYYCNGVLSADGHSWSTEGNVTPYLERAFGGFARSYTFGDDPITYSSSGFIWDHILAAGLSFRNYGEMDYAEPPEGMKYQAIWKAYQAGDEIEFKQKIGIERLRKYSCRNYPGWNMVIPDVLRMDRFLKEFRQFEKDGSLPNLCLVYLPQDHLGGGVTSHAHMADNDLALGRLVEAVSQSRFWDETVIFVNEDDPQNGYDHIDGHRSLCLVISPYSRRGINHSFYNQTAVLRTMLHIFGLPPMNQQDASMPLMTDCFTDQPINREPYKALAANVPLNQEPAPRNQQSATEQRWRAILATVPIQRTGMKTPLDEDNLNRFVWHEVKGWQSPYPSEWSGPHGRGLKELRLVLDENAEDD